MFFLISKLVYGLLMPTSLIVLAFIISLISKKDKVKSLTRVVGIGLLLLFTNPFLSSLAIGIWEERPKSYDELNHHYDYGILLTGVTDPYKVPSDRTHFNKGADRVIHTIELYKKGIISKIIITGGSGSITNQSFSESASLKSVVQMCGVPENDIIIESKSRNTYENATYTKELLQKLNSEKKVLLITSAFHMRRAAGCFSKANIPFDKFPTDYYGKPVSYTPDELIIPNIDALKEWTVLIKEWIGYVAYAIFGYL